MNVTGFKKTGFAIVAALAVVLSSIGVFAQDTTTTASPPAVAPSEPTASPTPEATAPALSYGASSVLQLSQAKIGDSTIEAYIQNSGVTYSLDASQIIYLKQQGVSEAVINSMLNQHNTMPTAGAQTPPQPQNYSQYPDANGSAQQNGVEQPSTAAPSAYSDTGSSSGYYSSSYPYYYYPYYYPSYYYYPYSYSYWWPSFSWWWPVSYYHGFYGYPYYHGWYYGGYHTWGGGWNGGGFHTYGGSSFHGNVGGGFSGGGFHGGMGGGGFHR